MMMLDILEEHLEEADFLWQQRENALADRVYTLNDLAELEERLLAHLDGLVLADKDGWDLLKPKLAGGEVGEVFAAAFVALESGDAARIEHVRNVLVEVDGDVLSGIRYALRHTNSSEAEKLVRPLLSSAKSPIRAAALDVLSFRWVPIDVGVLQGLLNDKDPIVVAAAVTAVGRLRVVQLKEQVEQVLGAENSIVRREAMKAGLLVGSQKALDAARNAVKKRAEEANDALILVALSGRSEDLALLTDAFNDPALVRGAITSLGLLGNIAAMELLLQRTADLKLSRLAGEAISRITGVDLKRGSLSAEAPSTAGPKTDVESEDDDEFEVDPNEGLPFPDPSKLSAWWRANASRFDKKLRYRKGAPYSQQVLSEILQTGTLPDRHHAAFEIAVMNAMSQYLETLAFARRRN